MPQKRVRACIWRHAGRSMKVRALFVAFVLARAASCHPHSSAVGSCGQCKGVAELWRAKYVTMRDCRGSCPQDRRACPHVRLCPHRDPLLGCGLEGQVQYSFCHCDVHEKGRVHEDQEYLKDQHSACAQPHPVWQFVVCPAAWSSLIVTTGCQAIHTPLRPRHAQCHRANRQRRCDGHDIASCLGPTQRHAHL